PVVREAAKDRLSGLEDQRRDDVSRWDRLHLGPDAREPAFDVDAEEAEYLDEHDDRRQPQDDLDQPPLPRRVMERDDRSQGTRVCHRADSRTPSGATLAFSRSSCFSIGMASAPRQKRNGGMVAAAGRGTARLVRYPVRAGLRSNAGVQARRDLGDAAVDALAAPGVEHLVDRLLAGPLPETVARSLVDNHVLERVVREALQRADLQAAFSSALASEEADALLEPAVQGPP